MRRSIRQMIVALSLAGSLCAAGTGIADDLTAQVQKDLVALGYDPGTISGDMTPATTVAVAKFEQDRGLKVSGSVSPEVAVALSAEVARQRSGGPVTASATSAAPAASDTEMLRAAQQACLQEKLAGAQEAQKKKRGLGRLFNAVARTATQFGNSDLQQLGWDVYDANATYDDLAGAARDLGLAESDIEACRKPQ